MENRRSFFYDQIDYLEVWSFFETPFQHATTYVPYAYRKRAT